MTATASNHRQLVINLTEDQYMSLLDRALEFRAKGHCDMMLVSQLPDLTDPYCDDVTVYLYLNTLAQGSFDDEA